MGSPPQKFFISCESDKKNIAAMGNSGFCMAETLKMFPLKVKFKWFLIMLVRSSTKILQNWQYLFLNDCDYKTLFLKNNKFRWFFEFGISCRSDKNMASVGNFRFWLAEVSKIFIETTCPNDLLHQTNDVCEVFYKDS